MIENAVSIKNADGTSTEIYLSELDVLVDEYTSGMDEETLSRPAGFLGLLKHLYMVKFRPSENRLYNSRSMLDSPEDISRLWDWYCTLCYRFQKTPTVLQFGILTGVDRHTFQDWADGSTRGANPAYSTVSKKMKAEAEAALESKAIETSSIGAIFGLKASHQWREAAPVTETYDQIASHDSPEQIAARHSAATLPQKPILDLEG